MYICSQLLGHATVDSQTLVVEVFRRNHFSGLGPGHCFSGLVPVRHLALKLIHFARYDLINFFLIFKHLLDQLNFLSYFCFRLAGHRRARNHIAD